MNAEQKKIALECIRLWGSEDLSDCAGDQMAALLQELVDAPEPEPVAWAFEIPVAGGYQTRFSEAKPTNILELNKRPLFAEHHAPCVPAMRSTNQWESSRIADYNRGWNECRMAMLSAPTPAEAPADVARDALLQVESEFAALLPGVVYMDEPDGGSPTVQEQIKRMALDAARYRWLRNENAKLGSGYYVGNDTNTMLGDITWIGSDLDAAIDAAMSEKGGA